jgi:hypothetical protein
VNSPVTPILLVPNSSSAGFKPAPRLTTELTMSQPVQIKIFFGMMLITRRTYLMLSFGGFALLAGIWITFKTILGPSSWLGVNILRDIPWFYTALPWILGTGVVLEILEMMFVLRKFRERNEFLRRERSDNENSFSHEM